MERAQVRSVGLGLLPEVLALIGVSLMLKAQASELRCHLEIFGARKVCGGRGAAAGHLG
jgi:hypothetical protein